MALVSKVFSGRGTRPTSSKTYFLDHVNEGEQRAAFGKRKPGSECPKIRRKLPDIRLLIQSFRNLLSFAGG